MKMRYVLSILTAFVLVAGLVSALPAGAEISGDTNYTWAGTNAGNITVDGGVIYNRDLDATMQTAKWAAIYGSVTGKIVLAGDISGTTYYVYNWTVSSITNGHAIFTESDSPDWSSLTASSATDVDTAWGFSGADRAEVTFDSTESDTLNGKTESSVPVVRTYNSTGGEFWETYLWDFGGSIAKDDFVFAGKIHNDEDAFDGSTVDFQVLVPVNASSGATELYYAYVELE